ncbi:mitochondrial ribosomal protein S18B [Calliopsis andreniformis]|uniref:mitochondrial ribosomal protein S18B n=1 Tax=Calliopsis andreniformis TaxID=337506 RepID=UPI003FCC5811
MSLILNCFQSAAPILRANVATKVTAVRVIHSTLAQFNIEDNVEVTDIASTVDFSKDRSRVIPVETSIRYLQSNEYKKTYGDYPVWKFYKRNFKGQYLPNKTRKLCIRNNVIATGSPCPICRDEYLVLHYRNINLLKQFISEYDGAILNYNKTGLCQKAHNNLLVAVLQAKEYGLLTFDVPFRHYNYSEWRDDNKSDSV